VPELGRTLGEELLEPTRIYARDCLALVDAVDVHAFSHVTGGGLAANLARVLPAGLSATLDRSTWSPAPVFGLVAEHGAVERGELERTLNMGVGMVAVVAPDDADAAVRLLGGRGVPAWVAGRVTTGDGSAALTGSHPA
jgi:phosphoribosylformylglycinamidine cyclo-ligase